MHSQCCPRQKIILVQKRRHAYKKADKDALCSNLFFNYYYFLIIFIILNQQNFSGGSSFILILAVQCDMVIFSSCCCYCSFYPKIIFCAGFFIFHLWSEKQRFSCIQKDMDLWPHFLHTSPSLLEKSVLPSCLHCQTLLLTGEGH